MRDLAAVLVLGLCCEAAADRVQDPCSITGVVVEMMPSSANAGSVKIFPTRAGFDAFWISGSAMYAAFTRAGQRVGEPQKLVEPMRYVTPGPDGTYGVTYQVSVKNRWQGHVAMMKPGAAPMWDAELPLHGRGHGNLAIGWDPHASAWIVVGEEQIQLPNQPDGYVYNRLFVARIDRKGALLEAPTYISDDTVSAQLNDWHDPLVVADNHVGVAWVATDGNRPATLYVTELDGAQPKRTRIATAQHGFMRVVLARTPAGYVIAGSESGSNIFDGRLFVTTLNGSSAGAMRYISTTGRNASEPVIATDGTRVAIAWNETETREVVEPSMHPGPPLKRSVAERTRARAVTIDAGGKLADAYTSATPSGRSDWVQSIAWDGCRFALVHTTGINPSGIAFVRF
jgi:hypothetical protein